MTLYSQNDPRWKNKKLGTGNGTIGKLGCALTCIAMLSDTRPDVLNDELIRGGAFVSGDLMVWDRAAALKGLPYSANRTSVIKYPVVVETDHYKPQGIPQHFYILHANGSVWDPADGKIKPNPYNKKSYRNVSTNQQTPPTGGIMDLLLEQFKAIYIFYTSQWPADTAQGRKDQAEWQASGKAPWQYMQDKYLYPDRQKAADELKAANDTIAAKDKEIAALKAEIANGSGGNPNDKKLADATRSIVGSLTVIAETIQGEAQK